MSGFEPCSRKHEGAGKSTELWRPFRLLAVKSFWSILLVKNSHRTWTWPIRVLYFGIALLCYSKICLWHPLKLKESLTVNTCYETLHTKIFYKWIFVKMSFSSLLHFSLFKDFLIIKAHHECDQIICSIFAHFQR